jgi:hypothetical protein
MFRASLSRCLTPLALVLSLGLVSPAAAAGRPQPPAAPAPAPAAAHGGWLAALDGWLRALVGKSPIAPTAAAAPAVVGGGAVHPGAGLDAGPAPDPDGSH